MEKNQTNHKIRKVLILKIVFTTKGTSLEAEMDSRFGRSSYLLLYDDANGTMECFDNRAVADAGHGAGPQTAKKVFDLKPDILITGNGPGGNAATILEKTGIVIYIGAGDLTVREALENYQKGLLYRL